MTRMKMHPTPTMSMKTVLKSDNRNTAIATLKQLCSTKKNYAAHYKEKAEEQEEGRNPTNDENKEDDTVLRSSLQSLRFNN